MSPEQCRMARAALKWSTQKLALTAGVNPSTVNNFENGKDSYASTAKKLREALEGSGLVRLDGDCCVCVESSAAQE